MQIDQTAVKLFGELLIREINDQSPTILATLSLPYKKYYLALYQTSEKKKQILRVCHH